MRLEVPMCPERFLHMPDPSELGMQLDGAEVFDVGALEEHVSDGGGLLVDL